MFQAAVGLEGMADGAVLSGLPRQIAQKFAAHAMMVSQTLVALFSCCSSY